MSQVTSGWMLDPTGWCAILYQASEAGEVCEGDLQAYLLGSAPSEVRTQDTQMQWLSTVLSLMLTCRAWF